MEVSYWPGDFYQHKAGNKGTTKMMIMYWMAVFAMMTVNIAEAQSYTSRRDSIGQTHFSGKYNGESYSGISRRDSIGQVHTNYNNGTKCVGRNVTKNTYQENCTR